MRFAYVGNFSAPYSTENDVARALRNRGHVVTQIPEQSLDWTEVPSKAEGADVFLWTRTAGFDPPDLSTQDWALKRLDIPTVGYHLDRWWGLDREADVYRSPWFTQDLLCTAHGSDQWEKHGIRHRWFPPGVSEQWTKPGHFRNHLRSEVAFVGNMESYGHLEWAPYRRRLASELRKRFSLNIFPGRNRKAIRGEQLTDLYTSGKVFIGDSCLVNSPERYWSDRVPETCGRGGFLIHPDVVGLKQQHPDLVTYTLGDFDELCDLVAYYLEHDDLRKGIAVENRRHVLAHHTYEHRVDQLVQTLKDEGML